MVKSLPASAGDLRDGDSLDGEDPLEEGMATTPVFLPGESLRTVCVDKESGAFLVKAAERVAQIQKPFAVI